jgi:hypothetical protein
MSERQPLQVGIDLRPIPLQMEDEAGTVWLFNPDPDKQFFATVARIKDNDDDDQTDPAYWDYIDELREVIGSQILDETERTEFMAREYGLKALDAIAKTYSAGVSGRPTEPSN